MEVKLALILDNILKPTSLKELWQHKGRDIFILYGSKTKLSRVYKLRLSVFKILVNDVSKGKGVFFVEH